MIKKVVKVLIRVIFVVVSSCMAIANFPAFSWGLVASCLFLTGNLLALIVNFPTFKEKHVCKPMYPELS